MKTPRLGPTLTLASFVIGSCLAAPPVLPQLHLEILPQNTDPTDGNFRLAGTFGFSVSWLVSDEYRLYATTVMQRHKWDFTTTPPQTSDLFFADGERDICWNLGDPRAWDNRCIDVIGLFHKSISCASGDPCQNDGHWNAYPGFRNVSVDAFPPLWPQHTDYGVSGFTPVLTKNDVNDTPVLPAGSNCHYAAPCPPKTGAQDGCFPNNLDEYATGVANGKTVQVYYTGGVSRWFMAFNTLIHSEDQHGTTGADKWRIAWARSDDGRSWTVDPQLLMRNVTEAHVPPDLSRCARGVLVTQMFIDNGHFYILFTSVGDTANVYMARALIDPSPSSVPGYATAPGFGAWELATMPLQGGLYTWTPFALGSQLDLGPGGLNAASVMPLVGVPCPFTRQASVARVFTSSNPPRSRYVGVASDVTLCTFDNRADTLNLYTTDTLNEPFVYESHVGLSDAIHGLFGPEFAFTHYPDNLPASPRIVADELDFWLVQNRPTPDYNGVALDTALGLTSVSRRTARITGGIFGCSLHRVLDGETVSGDFAACDTITASAVAVVRPGAAFQATHSITLRPGFSVALGAAFSARIAPKS